MTSKQHEFTFAIWPCQFQRHRHHSHWPGTISHGAGVWHVRSHHSHHTQLKSKNSRWSIGVVRPWLLDKLEPGNNFIAHLTDGRIPDWVFNFWETFVKVKSSLITRRELIDKQIQESSRTLDSTRLKLNNSIDVIAPRSRREKQKEWNCVCSRQCFAFLNCERCSLSLSSGQYLGRKSSSNRLIKLFAMSLKFASCVGGD